MYREVGGVREKARLHGDEEPGGSHAGMAGMAEAIAADGGPAPRAVTGPPTCRDVRRWRLDAAVEMSRPDRKRLVAVVAGNEDSRERGRRNRVFEPVG